jgi:peptidoglycan/xylan/chitin deacetylase (PgdA/CDA1 family)
MKQPKVKLVVGLLALCALVLLSLPLDADAFPAKNVPVLLYHKVYDEALTTYWVSADNFREQMFLLHDLGYETVDFDQLYAHVMGVVELPNKPVIVTFDDAYQNAYTHALPVFNEHS